MLRVGTTTELNSHHGFWFAGVTLDHDFQPPNPFDASRPPELSPEETDG